MKKFIAIVAAALAFAAVASAQPRAIGLRAGYGGEISYQHNLGSNFLEADLGWFTNSFNLTGVYNFNIGQAGDFNFYAGPGAYLGGYSHKTDDGTEAGFGLGIVGQLGVEYQFGIPLNISLDWRPAFSLIPGTAFGWNGIALGLRYRF